MTTTVDDFTEQRSFASNVTFLVGEAAVQLDVVPLRRTGSKQEASLKSVCPNEHEAPTTVRQFYECEHGHKHTDGQLLKARALDDGSLVLIDKDEASELRTGGFAKNQMIISAHPADEVAAQCRPDELGYRLRPNRKSAPIARKLYSTLMALASTDGVALLGELRLKDSRRLYRLEVWNGQLIVQSLIHPDDLAGTDQIALPEFDKAQIKALQDRARELVDSFDPERYRFDAKAALDAAAAARAGNKDMPAPAPQVVTPEDIDVLELLGASITKASKARKAKKATTKRAA